MKIVRATERDIRGILAVQKSVLIKNFQDNFEEAKRHGFLVYRISSRQLRGVLKDRTNIVLCAKENGEVGGYILSYNIKNWMKYKPYWLERLRVSKRVKDLLNNKKGMYLRHIARKKCYYGGGRKLLKYFINLVKRKKIEYIVCEILEKYPENERSKKFFRKFNFERIGSISYEDGLKWGVYMLKI